MKNDDKFINHLSMLLCLLVLAGAAFAAGYLVCAVQSADTVRAAMESASK